MPSTVPTACGALTQPETNPRWLTGTWSEIVAVRAADRMQNPMIASDQQMPMPIIVVCRPSATRASAKTTVPTRIHGRRRPKRDVVRSDSAPVSG